MSVGIWDRFCLRNPAHVRLRVTETTGGKTKRELGFPAWLVQLHGAVCWCQWSRVCWHSPCSVCSGINPRVKSGRFMKILPDYEHMEYRDVYTCRTYPAAAAASLHPARPGCCMECALAWSKALGVTLGQQGGATSRGWCHPAGWHRQQGRH